MAAFPWVTDFTSVRAMSHIWFQTVAEFCFSEWNELYKLAEVPCLGCVLQFLWLVPWKGHFYEVARGYRVLWKQIFMDTSGQRQILMLVWG